MTENLDTDLIRAEAERRYGRWPLETDDPSWAAFEAGAQWAAAEAISDRFDDVGASRAAEAKRVRTYYRAALGIPEGSA